MNFTMDANTLEAVKAISVVFVAVGVFFAVAMMIKYGRNL
jgi:hypothetical protein